MSRRCKALYTPLVVRCVHGGGASVLSWRWFAVEAGLEMWGVGGNGEW